MLRYHLPNDLVAFSCEDMTIRVVDIETKKLARELRGCVATINDFVSFHSTDVGYMTNAMPVFLKRW